MQKSISEVTEELEVMCPSNESVGRLMREGDFEGVLKYSRREWYIWTCVMGLLLFIGIGMALRYFKAYGEDGEKADGWIGVAACLYIAYLGAIFGFRLAEQKELEKNLETMSGEVDSSKCSWMKAARNESRFHRLPSLTPYLLLRVARKLG